jgi:hypothetical protein
VQGQLQATPEDLKRWEREGRGDILQLADVMAIGFADLWFNPSSGEELEECPFLRKTGRAEYECTIHDTAPEQCADWWCILCEDNPRLFAGTEVHFGAEHYVVSDSPGCPECGKKNICRQHEFICRDWVEKQVRYYGRRT